MAINNHPSGLNSPEALQGSQPCWDDYNNTLIRLPSCMLHKVRIHQVRLRIIYSNIGAGDIQFN